MEKIVKSGFRDCTVTLDGTECSVKFDSCHRVFSVRNDGTADVYISKSANIVPDADGIMCVKSGGSAVFAHMDMYTDTVYLLGTGKVQIHAQNDTINPFKSAPVQSGGGETAGYISDGLVTYSALNDAIFNNIVTDSILNRIVNRCNSTSGNGCNVIAKNDVTDQLTDGFSIQILCRTTTLGNYGIFGCVYDSPFCAAMMKIENGLFGIERASGNFMSSAVINDDKWHMLTAAYSNSVLKLYVDGVNVLDCSGTWNITANAKICIGEWVDGTGWFEGYIANACIYNRCLSESEILQNWQTDASRYGIGGV